MIEKDYTIDEQYKDLLETILTYGKEKQDRTGTGTKSIFGYTLRHDMTQGFPLLTTKKVAVKSMITELRWFLKGRTDIQYLRDNNCKIWDGDYNKSGKTDGSLGPIYGKQWRDWDGEDQIKNLIIELKENPDSRRLMVNAWNVGELDKMTLPPCHYGFQIYTTELTLEERQQEFCDRLGKSIHYAKNLDHDFLDKDEVPKRKISLMWNQRSVDVFLGLPFNIASYALLLKLIADEVNMVPDQLVGNLGDTHLYLNHLDQAKEQLTREPYCLPELEVSKVDLLNGDFNYELHGYESHPSIKAPLSN
jgi:thymidylate synthase